MLVIDCSTHKSVCQWIWDWGAEGGSSVLIEEQQGSRWNEEIIHKQNHDEVQPRATHPHTTNYSYTQQADGNSAYPGYSNQHIKNAKIYIYKMITTF